MISLISFIGFIAWKSFIEKENIPQRPVKVRIEKGMNAGQIGNLLQDKKVIKNALVFKLIVRRRGVEAEFKPGEYEFKTGMDYNQVIQKLVEGPPITYYEITQPEGWTAKQIAARIGTIAKINEDEYLGIVEQGQAGLDYPFLKNNGSNTNSLEGYLFPKTYRIKKGTNAQQFVNLQLAEFQEQTANLNWANAQTLGRTPYEIIIVASLIERESKVDEERPIVASVIYNRLKKGMLLQIDATVQYALPQWKDRLTYEDLKVDSPYNTYKHAGLPPGPICNPGLAAIQAALNPATSDYLYYVLAPDNSGRHTFTRTYDEFLKAANQYHQSQKSQNNSGTAQQQN